MNPASSKKEEPAGTGPKVLRIGIIQGGKIIEERRLKRRETVSIGSNPKANFVVTSAQVPKSFDLFEYAGDQYFLRFAEGMDGRIQLTGDSVSDFNALKTGSKAVKRGAAMGVELNDASRGKVMLGDVTVLFQFVDPPAAAAKIELPTEARGSVLSMIDVQFSSIFVVTALLLISVVAYARGLPYIEPTTVEELGESYQKMIMPDRIPEPTQVATDDAKGKDKEKDEGKGKEKDDGKAKGAKGKSKSADKGPVDAEAAARAKKEALAKAVAGKGLLGVIGTKGAGGAINDVFADGGFGEGNLGDAFSGIQGVDLAEGSGAKGTRGGGGGESTSLGSLGTEGGGGRNVSVGGKAEADVSGRVGAEAPTVDGDLSPDVIKAEMSKRMRSLKDCYDRALKRTPTLKGKIVLAFEILESGRVSSLKVEEDSVGSAEVKACILDRAKSWHFPPPSGGSVFVSTPLVFTPAS
jgi:TonB family protein